MVSISSERWVATERRLKAVLRAAHLAHLDGAWCFQRTGGTPPEDAIATVRDRDGWCALVPAPGDAGERFGVTLTTFAPEIENSGFVGWLATALKRRLGSGVFVICGDNPRRGGIFDYLGYPIAIASEVRVLLDELRRAAGRDPLDLDLRVFEVVETSPASAISHDTWFEFRERDGVVEASYAGGKIASGRLLGRRDRDRVTTAYAQLDRDGQLQTGTGILRVDRDSDQRLLLTEDYTWSSGTTGRNVLRSVEPADAD
jgi:hypothetical protein